MPAKPKHRTAIRQRSSMNGNVKASLIVKLSRSEIVDFLEKGARARMGMSAKSMLRRYRHGKLAHPNGVIDLIALSNLLRKDDPILAE
jgi:hypothetical protein